MKEILAAGGIVIHENFLLVIKRNGFFDLPKGHLEKNETIEDCAIREVEEECGINGLYILGSPQITFHQYELGGEIISKKTYWYPMQIKRMQKPKPKPQLEEGIEEAMWINIRELDIVMKHTHDNLIPIFEAVLNNHNLY